MCSVANPASSRLTRAGWVAAALLVTGAGAVALQPVTRGDNYCGRVYFDTARTAPCGSVMSARTAVCAALILAAVILGAALVVRSRPRRELAVAVLTAVSAALVLVGVNRVLEPTSPMYCGSVLNRHRASDAQIDRRCDDLLAAFKGQTAAAFAGASVVGVSAALYARRAGRGTAAAEGK